MKRLSFLFIGLSLSAGLAEACPENLKNFHSDFLRGQDVCRLHDRYQAALDDLRNKGFFPPERLGNLMAPRFINLPDWTAKRDRSHDRALKVYDPAPITWSMWEAGAKIVDDQALKNYSQQKITPLTLDWLKRIHGATLKNLLNNAGNFRQSGEVGLALEHKTALLANESQAVLNMEYKAADGSNLISFRPTQCMEDHSADFQNNFKVRLATYGFDKEEWPAIDAKTYYTDEKGQPRQCGFYSYSPIEQVPDQLNRWTEFINTSTATWGGLAPQGDPILVAARAQRWLIAVHPFPDGNGRTSRFVMDLVLKSIGLPAPILENMDGDLYSTEKEWSTKVGEGVLRAVRIAEFCRFRPGGKGCSIITQDNEGVAP